MDSNDTHEWPPNNDNEIAPERKQEDYDQIGQRGKPAKRQSFKPTLAHTSLQCRQSQKDLLQEKSKMANEEKKFVLVSSSASTKNDY